tara:strand:+ start:26 stop:517 length:492 start_codon:yes stop_codon:yes gene_type:complete
MEKATLGTVIHGTHRSQDLIPAFFEMLNTLGDRDRVQSIRDEFKIPDSELIGSDLRIVDDHPWWTSEDASYLINEVLIDALNDHAPAFCYFGSHEGDGSDFGFWPCMDSIDAAVGDREAVQVSDLSEIPREWIGDAFLINDHGNLTCGHVDQAGEFHSEWAIV